GRTRVRTTLAPDAGGVRNPDARARGQPAAMTKLVFVTQQLDREHPTLGAAADMVAALAARVDEVVVLAASASADALPANVRFRSFAAPAQLLRGARF